MVKQHIRLLYRKIIDAHSRKTWEQHVFEDSYTELLMQAQYFDQEKKYSTLGELLTYVPGAEKLHFLVSPSVMPHRLPLNGKVPDILNATGQHFLPFKNFRFEIINSNIRQKAQHQVAINFLSEPVTWYNTIGNQLLVTLNDTPDEEGRILTELLTLQPFLNIHDIKPHS
jgi:hypothetical protein